MKNSNEWLQEIKEKADARFAEQKRRRKIIVSISSSAACLALILCSALMLPNMFDSGLTIGVDSSGTTQTLDNNTTLQHSNASDSQEEQPDNPSTPSTSGTEPDKPDVIPVDFTVNNIIGQMSAAKMHYDPAKYYTETWTPQQITDYYGIDFSKISYKPKDLSYVEQDHFTMIFSNDGKMAENYSSHFSYTGENGRELTILVSKSGRPYDCIYSLETSKTEKINGNEVLIGGMLKSEGSNEYGFFYADFEADGINYRVKADNLTGEEFYKAVEGVIGLK